MAESTKAYLPDGTPAPRMVQCKTKDGFRPITSKDVIANGWYFSTTTIIGQVTGAGLIYYFEDQIMEATATSPLTAKFFAGEITQEAWKAGLREEAAEHREAAAGIGTAVDGAVCCVLEGKSYEHLYSDLTPPGYLDPTVAKVIEELGRIAPIGGWLCQVPFVDHKRRYAGTIDLKHPNNGKTIRADMKTQGRKPGKTGKLPPFQWYDKWAQQLAAYAMGDEGSFGRTINLAIDSKVPGLVAVREWNEEEMWRAWHQFDALRTYFLLDKYGLDALREAA